MRLLSMGWLIILILAGCASNIPTVVPPMEKYCPAPVRPVIEQKAAWTVQDLLQANMVIIDYTLKLEQTVGCWEGK
jgi:hypothetical protein